MKNKPCPFCNADPVKDTAADPNKRKGKLYAIYCDDCGTAATGWCDTEGEADRRWNTRVPVKREKVVPYPPRYDEVFIKGSQELDKDFDIQPLGDKK